MPDVRDSPGDDLPQSPNDDQPDDDDHSPMHAYPAMPVQMYGFAPPMTAQPRTKRRQVKNACTNCQKACKKCDDARPCLRCVKYGIAEECVDSQRKERRKGLKRGPYKKRDGKAEQPEAAHGQALPLPAIPPGAAPAAVPYMAPMGYPPPPMYQPQPQPGVPAKPGDQQPQPAYYPQFYLAPLPAPPAQGQEGENPAYPQHPQPQYYQAAFIAPYAHPYPPYVMPPPRPGEAPMQPVPAHHYQHYPPVYHKPPSADEPGAEGSHGHSHPGRRDSRGMSIVDSRSG